MRLCAITDRRRLSNPPETLLRLVKGWAAGGVQFIQLREKDLGAAELQSLTRLAMESLGCGDYRSRSRLLVNVASPAAAALAAEAGADGVHLAGKPVAGAAAGVRDAFHASGREAIISLPCHTLQDIQVAVKEQVDLVLFSPVFEKGASVPHGLQALHRACSAAHGIPLLALGGVTSSNAADCVAAGAAGIAGIRLFVGDDWRRLAAI